MIDHGLHIYGEGINVSVEPIVSKVYQICNRYESGYGHGLKRDGLDLAKTPHADAEMGEAYQIGYDAGSIEALSQSAPVGEPDAVTVAEALQWNANLIAAMKNLLFTAQTTGGTAGPDAGLMKAIEHASQVMSLCGFAKAIGQATHPAPVGEPVAWTGKGSGVITSKTKAEMIKQGSRGGEFASAAKSAESFNIPLYTHPAPEGDSEMTDMQIMEVFDGKDFCADDYTPESMKMYKDWLPRIRAVIAAAFAKRNESTREAVIEECAKAAKDEALVDCLSNTEDAVYNMAVRHCVDAIRALSTAAMPTGSETK